jgi:hypothetical protein
METIITHLLPSSAELENEWSCTSIPLFVQISGTLDTLQNLTNSADPPPPPPHNYQDPHTPKAQLAVTLKYRIIANKEPTYVHCKDLIKPM